MTFDVESLGWRVTVPAGTYYVGDPCYVITDDAWGPLLSSCDFFRKPVGVIDGGEVLAFPTRWGDGTYYDQLGNDYSVDAGLIGVVPEALWADLSGKYQHIAGDTRAVLATLGQVIQTDRPMVCESDGTGTLRFGPITINTND